MSVPMIWTNDGTTILYKHLAAGPPILALDALVAQLLNDMPAFIDSTSPTGPAEEHELPR